MRILCKCNVTSTNFLLPQRYSMLEPDYDERPAAEAVKNGPDIAARLTIFGSSDYSFI